MTKPAAQELIPEIKSEFQARSTLPIMILSLLVSVAAMLLFGWLADEVHDRETLQFDNAIRTAVHSYANPALTRAMIVVSFLGKEFLFVAPIVAALIFWRVRWIRAAAWLVVTMAGALVLDLTLKYAFHRPRPTPYFVALPHTYSFPSGHSLMSFCFYGVMAGLLAARLQRLWTRVAIWTFAVCLIASIGFSRIYLGVHYPSDVVGGYLAAAVWVSTMIALDHWRRGRKNDSG